MIWKIEEISKKIWKVAKYSEIFIDSKDLKDYREFEEFEIFKGLESFIWNI